jgi:4-oxalocrotonate tautomerase
MVEVQGESLRRLTCCVVEEVASGEWGIGGEILTADDVKALARGEAA